MAEILLFFLTTSKAIFWADEAKLDEETGINFSLVNLNIYIIFILIILFENNNSFLKYIFNYMFFFPPIVYYDIVI
jgi:hypothetical protein